VAEEEEKKPEMIKHVGQILNEDGEWVEYVEEVPADKPPIAYTYMGGEHCPIEPDSEVVDFCMQYRIPKIEGLEDCKNLKKLGLRKNLVKKIENIEHCTEMVELELYDNRLTKIENI
jgi:Leucine-rich repeat (LRR) protein